MPLDPPGSKPAGSRINLQRELFDDSSIVRKDSRSAKYCPEEQDGDICKMTHRDAVQYCKEQGGHLLSTRELAQYMNPNCILECDYVENELQGNAPQGYYKVASEDDDGKPDAFYFSNAGSRLLKGDVASNSFWTSSLVLGNREYAHVFYGALGGGGGPDHEHARTYRHAVIVINRQENITP